MKTKVLLSLVVVTALINVINDASAQNYRYKWKSTDGQVHYTDRPPANGIEYTKIRVETDKRVRASSKPTLNPSVGAAQKEEQKKEDTYSGWRKENCTRATQNLDILENSGRVAKDDGQGGTRLMTDEEKEEQIKSMQELKAKYCSDEQ